MSCWVPIIQFLLWITKFYIYFLKLPIITKFWSHLNHKAQSKYCHRNQKKLIFYFLYPYKLLCYQVLNSPAVSLSAFVSQIYFCHHSSQWESSFLWLQTTSAKRKRAKIWLSHFIVVELPFCNVKTSQYFIRVIT